MKWFYICGARYERRVTLIARWVEWAIKQDQYTVIEYTRREAAAITHTLKRDDSELAQEHKTVCLSLLGLSAVSHSEELLTMFSD